MGAANPGTTLTRSGRGSRQMEWRGSRVIVGRSRETGVGVGRGGWSGEGQKCCGSKERVGSGCGSRLME